MFAHLTLVRWTNLAGHGEVRMARRPQVASLGHPAFAALYGNPWTSFLSKIETAGWLANFLGSMIGVAIAALVALYVLKAQLKQQRDLFAEQSKNDRDQFAEQSKNDRDLFERALQAERDKENRDRRRSAALELAAKLKPAADRLKSFRELDVRQEVWPDYRPTYEAVSGSETLLFVNDLYEVYKHAVSVLNICYVVWDTSYRTAQECMAQNPRDYEHGDPRILGSMILAMLMAGRRQLADLVATLLAWNGEGQPGLPPLPSAADLNAIAPAVRREMTKSLGRDDWIAALDRQLADGIITEKEYEAKIAQVTSLKSGESALRPPWRSPDEPPSSGHPQ